MAWDCSCCDFIYLGDITDDTAIKNSAIICFFFEILLFVVRAFISRSYKKMAKATFDETAKENQRNAKAAYELYLTQYNGLLLESHLLDDNRHSVYIHQTSLFEYSNLSSLKYASRFIKCDFPDGIPASVWVNSDSLIILPDANEDFFDDLYIDLKDNLTPQTVMITIQYKQLEYYKKDGDIHYEQVISGGNGGDISVSGALVGGMIAGDVGAVIGSRKPMEAIKSNTVQKDTRCTILKTSVGVLQFDLNAYDVFLEILPQKEYDVIRNAKIRSSTASLFNDNNENEIKSRLVKLNELKTAGLITDIEYETKKAEILSAL